MAKRNSQLLASLASHAEAKASIAVSKKASKWRMCRRPKASGYAHRLNQSSAEMRKQASSEASYQR